VRALVEGAQPLPPGHALDVGCGTGTSTVYLADHGWQATGVDWVAAALDVARQRAAACDPGTGAARFVHADVTALEFLPDHPPLDLWLDVGCLHGLPAGGQAIYAGHAARLLRPGARLLIYCWGRFLREGEVAGLDPDELVALFRPDLVLISQVQSRDSVDQTRSAGWYTFERRMG
jgi:SAM-dependent methyltransferase